MIIRNYFKVRVCKEVDGVVKWDFRNHLTKLRVGKLCVYFSFETPIAIQHPNFHRNIADKDYYNGFRSKNIYVCDNFWGKATAFHMNQLDGGDTDDRVSREFIKEQILELLPKELNETRWPWEDRGVEEAPFIGNRTAGSLLL